MTPAEITRAREDLGLTQRALAEHLGVAANTINRWEAGSAIPPPYLTIVFEAMQYRKAPAMCGAGASHNRVCAAQAGHAGDHQLVLRSTRED